jgi:ferrochelatase
MRLTSPKIEHSHPPVKHGKVGVLLVNLGTPGATDYTSMRRYLKEFLMDKRVIEWPRIAWYPILFGIVLNTRPGKVGKAYETIWNKEKNESFLRTYTRSQAELMAEALKDHANVIVDWAMRYGQPSIASRMEYLQKAGCERILVFPLYPQYAAATTATVNDKAFETLLKMRWQPALRTVPPYHDDPAYIDALAVSIEKHLATLDWLVVTFQSRFGPEEWLQPYTDKTVEKLAQEGVKRIAVLNPGFVSDCLETLEEIAEEAADSFLHNGGEKFAHIPCLNDSPEGMKVLEKIVRRELSGWVNPKAP